MKWTLMHKDVPVVDMSTRDHDGRISNFGTIHNHEHLPIGTSVSEGKNKGKLKMELLDDWWISRAIPHSRDGLKAALDAIGLRDATQLLTLSNALSLSDQYWIRPYDKDLKWEDVNFFDNDFSLDVGKTLFGQGLGDIARGDLCSPDNSSIGWLMKRWLRDQPRILQKGGSGAYELEPFNEVVASKIAKGLGIPCVPYEIALEEDKYYSLCENFITKDTELVPAWDILKGFAIGREETVYEQLLRCSGERGIGHVRDDIDKMIVLDYLIANEDRHFYNFGFIRDANALEWRGFAPLYDNGTSLWYSKQIEDIGIQDKAKTFRKTHERQINLAKDLSWLSSITLSMDDITDKIPAIYAMNTTVKNLSVREEWGHRIAMEIAKRYDTVMARSGLTVPVSKSGDASLFEMPTVTVLK